MTLKEVEDFVIAQCQKYDVEVNAKTIMVGMNSWKCGYDYVKSKEQEVVKDENKNQTYMNKTINYVVGDDISTVIEKGIHELRYKQVEDPSCKPLPFSESFVKIYTGCGGRSQVQDMVRVHMINDGVDISKAINYAREGSETVYDEDIQARYIRFELPYFLDNTKVYDIPSMTPVLGDDITNPYVKGFRLCSYNYKLIDVKGNELDIIATLG